MTRRPLTKRLRDEVATEKVAHWAGGLMMLAFSALLVATLLVPSEAMGEEGTGAVLVVLWLALLVVWAVVGWWRREGAVRWSAVDGAVAVFLALVVVSAWVSVPPGYPRATINMAWQWLSFGVCFFLARQLFRTPAAMRAVCSVMIGLAICLATLGFYQRFYSQPRTRADFARDPEGMLREAGIDAAPGSPERKLYEDRLNSTEPTATFALANSLAGFVAPWLILALGVAAGGRQGRRVLVAAIVIGGCLAACLLLTKSRTAVLATAVGVLLLAWTRLADRWSLRRRLGAAAAVAAVVLAVGAVLAGAFDRLVLTETPKSVLYRVQYWQASLSMIAERPWFGCGPGNFQQTYTAFKLPEASETIADPHNFLLEVWATAGTPAAIVLVLVLVLAARRVWRAGAETVDEADASADAWMPVYLGGVLGIGLGYLVGLVVGYPPDLAVIWLGAPAGAAGVWAWHAWTVRGRLAVATPAVAFVVLTANLLAAGGIGFAGVAGTWWLLLAVSLGVVEERETHRHRGHGGEAGRRGGWWLAFALAAVAATGLCYVTLYRPVLQGRMLVDEGRSWLRQGNWARAEAAFRDATRADRLNAEPWQELASLGCSRTMAEPGGSGLAEFERAVEALVHLRGGSSATYRHIGDWRLALFRATGDRGQLEQALLAYETRVRLYPNESLGHAQLAWVFHVAGDPAAAARQATEALRLDALCPHRERKLAAQHLDDSAAEIAQENAELVMQRLRRYDLGS